MARREVKASKRKCEHCGKPYVPVRDHQRFDSPACRIAAWRRDHVSITREELERLREGAS